MTVDELIELLLRQPGDAEVLLQTDNERRGEYTSCGLRDYHVLVERYAQTPCVVFKVRL